MQIEAYRKLKDGGCCSDKNKFATTQIETWHKHLDRHRSRGEVVPQEYYEMRIIP